MKKANVVVGCDYLARVSGRLVTVRVERAEESYVRGRTQYHCRNLTTGREVVCSAARLRQIQPSGQSYGNECEGTYLRLE